MAAAMNKKTGKWYSKFYYKDYSGNRIQKKKEGFTRKKDAIEYEKEYKARHEGKERLTFGQAYDLYITDCEKRQKPGTIAQKKYIYRHFQPMSNLIITDITPKTIRQWQNDYLLEMKENGKTKFNKDTIARYNAMLSNFFSWCEKFCGLQNNPVKKAGTINIKDDIEKPSQQANKGIWTKGEFEQFLAKEDKIEYRAAFSILFYLGLRRGELLGLRVKDLDIENRICHVRQNMTEYGTGTTKTKSSVRDVTIPKLLIKDIEEYMERIYNKRPSDLIFPTIKLRNLNQHFQATIKKGDVKKIRIHDLRHSHASMLINLGFTPDIVADRLGHKNATMVMKVYGHMYPEKRTDVVDAIDAL